jgi:hypothetical protein
MTGSIFLLAFHLWAFPALELPDYDFLVPPIWLAPAYLVDA